MDNCVCPEKIYCVCFDCGKVYPLKLRLNFSNEKLLRG